MSYKTPILTSIYRILAVLCFVVAAFGLVTSTQSSQSLSYAIMAASGIVLVGLALLGAAQFVAFVGEIAFNTRILVNQGAPKGTGQKSEPAQNSSASYRIPGID